MAGSLPIAGRRLSKAGIDNVATSLEEIVRFGVLDERYVLESFSADGALAGLSPNQRLYAMLHYIQNYGEEHNQDVERILSFVKGKGYRIVLDAASGPGISSAVILNELRPEKLWLVDAFPEALELARERLGNPPRVFYVRGRIEHLDEVVEGPFDLITMVASVSYLNYPLTQTFTAAKNVLKAGGGLLFDTPSFNKRPEFLDLAVARVVAFSIDDAYGTDLSNRLGRIETTLKPADFIVTKLREAGFDRIEVNEVSDYVPVEEVRFHVGKILSAVIEDVKGVSIGDYQRLEEFRDSLLEAACDKLAGIRLNEYAATVFLATT